MQENRPKFLRKWRKNGQENCGKNTQRIDEKTDVKKEKNLQKFIRWLENDKRNGKELNKKWRKIDINILKRYLRYGKIQIFPHPRYFFSFYHELDKCKFLFVWSDVKDMSRCAPAPFYRLK